MKFKGLLCKAKCCMPVLCLAAMLLIGCSTDEKKTIVCWGDSLTMQHKDYGIRGNIRKWLSGNFIDDSYPGFLEEMLGSEYNIVNCGVGGENTLTIATRQGSIPMFFNEDVVFDSAVDEVSIENDILRSSWDSTVVAPLHQSRWKEGSPARINPCYVDGKEFLLKCQRVECENTTMFKYSLKRTTERQDRYIVISFHKPNSVVKQVKEMEAMEDSLSLTFGRHYINLRDYMVARGIKDASLYATSEDIDSIMQGQVPPQLMTDGTHFNVYGCKLIAELVANKMKELGY